MLGEPGVEVRRPPGVVPGVSERPVEMQQVDRRDGPGDVGDGARWEVAQARRAIVAAELPRRERRVLTCFRAVQRELPGLQLALLTETVDPRGPGVAADLTLVLDAIKQNRIECRYGTSAAKVERSEGLDVPLAFHVKTPTGPDVYETARLAVGACYSVVDEVMSGRLDNGYALVRPPGHHARRDEGVGSCILANAVLATLHAKAHHGTERSPRK